MSRTLNDRSVVNKNTQDAHIVVNLYFENKIPVKELHLTLPAERVVCLRTDLSFRKAEFKIPFGQYSLELESDIAVCASFGLHDRRYNLGYYVTGYCAK